jgi:hypothetical protein
MANGRKIYQMDIKYTKIFLCKILQNLPKFGFLVCKYTIWQPCAEKVQVIVALPGYDLMPC